jgi:pyruvate dehydrogenase E2 component (dihydrolipoamide acetyltransferase)
MSEVNMPKLSDTMEEGTVLEWKKQDGDEVKRGDVLAEIESDKASFEIEAESDGALHIVVGQGKPVPVGEKIATIGEAAAGGGKGKVAPPAAEKPAAEKAAPEKPEKPAKEPLRPAAQATSPTSGEDETAQATSPTSGEDESEDETQEATSPTSGEDGAKASPLARRLARERGVDLAALKGSGPGGRIVKEDVLAAAGQSSGKAPATGQRRPAEAAEPARPAAHRPQQDVEVEEPTRMQATIARRMAQSKSTVPHFYVTVEANVAEAVKMRQQLKETVPGADRVTMTDMLMRACALALQRFPEVNASWVDGHFERKRRISIGLAVPPEKGLGLLVPVVHDVDKKDLVALSIEARQVIERARAGRPSAGDLEGGTFSISNLGMYGVDEFLAIINPPEAGILAVGAIKDAPVVVDGQLAVGKVMRLTLSVDHRVYYGVTGAQFLGEVKRLIENPVSLVMPIPED